MKTLGHRHVGLTSPQLYVKSQVKINETVAEKKPQNRFFRQQVKDEKTGSSEELPVFSSLLKDKSES